MKDSNVKHPSHYANTTSLECIEAMQITFGIEAVIAFCKCNAYKYLWRYKHKNGEEDLQKAKWYCEKLRVLINENEVREESFDSQFIELERQIMIKLQMAKKIKNKNKRKDKNEFN